jgi:hypothetical protein
MTDLLGDKRDPAVDGAVVIFLIDKIREVAYPLTLHITIAADNETHSWFGRVRWALVRKQRI